MGCKVQQLALGACFLASLSLDASNVLQCDMEAESGWEAAPHEYSKWQDLFKDLRTHKPNAESMHIQLHGTDLARLPFVSKLKWMVEPPAWQWFFTCAPGMIPQHYKDTSSWPIPSSFVSAPASSGAPVFQRVHLTCTNKRAQADEQKIARNERLLALPAIPLLCMCSMMAPSEFSHLRKRSVKKLHFYVFLEIAALQRARKSCRNFSAVRFLI